MPAAGKKRRRYKTLEVDRVDLVDRGANFDRSTGDGSHILLVKRDPSASADVARKQAVACPGCEKPLPLSYGDGGMTMPNYCPECGSKLTLRATAKSEETNMPAATEPNAVDVQKVVADALAKAHADFEKRLADERAAIEKAAADRAEKAETEKAALAERLSKAEQAAAAEVEKRETAECVDVAKGYASLALDPAKDGALLYRIGKVATAEDNARIREILAAANEQVRVGKLFSERGHNGNPTADVNGNPEQQLMAKAEEIRKADPKLSDADAVVEARARYPELRQKYDAWMAERAR
jgi:hypothetical protein